MREVESSRRLARLVDPPRQAAVGIQRPTAAGLPEGIGVAAAVSGIIAGHGAVDVGVDAATPVVPQILLPHHTRKSLKLLAGHTGTMLYGVSSGTRL